MSEKLISIKITTDGEMQWDRYTPNEFHMIHCPHGGSCRINCPLFMIEETRDHINFNCGNTIARFSVELICKTEADASTAAVGSASLADKEDKAK